MAISRIKVTRVSNEEGASERYNGTAKSMEV